MAYGLDLGLFAGSGPTTHPAKSAARSSARRYQAWRSLGRERRLALVDEALNAGANDGHCGSLCAAL